VLWSCPHCLHKGYPFLLLHEAAARVLSATWLGVGVHAWALGNSWGEGVGAIGGVWPVMQSGLWAQWEVGASRVHARLVGTVELGVRDEGV